MRSRLLTRLSISPGEALYILAIFAFMLFWACFQAYDFGCDESRRLLIPEYIYSFGELPTARDPLVIFQPYGFSYASMFTLLPSIVGAGFMKLVSFFSTDNYALLIGARLPSVLLGTASVYIVIRLSKLLFNTGSGRRVFICLITLLPEFIFLSSFFNSDIYALFFSFLIIWSMLDMRDGHWGIATHAKLVIGLAGCMLSYLNTYIWIPVCVCYYFIQGRNSELELTSLIKRALAVALAVTLLVSPLVIRQILLYGNDLTGSKVCAETAELYADKDFDLNAYDSSALKSGYSVADVLLGNVPENYSVKRWIDLSRESFYGRFGYSDTSMPLNVIRAYRVLTGIGLLAGIVCFILHRRQKPYPKQSRTFFMWITIAFILINALSIYYSLANSYQPQARYVYPVALFFIMYVAAKGWVFLSEKLHRETLCSWLIAGAMVVLLVLATLLTFLPAAAGDFTAPVMDMSRPDYVQVVHGYK